MRDRLPMIFSITALLVAVLGVTPLGDAAYNQLVPRNSVGTLQLQRNAVKAAKIAPNAVRTGHVLDGTLLVSDFKAGQIPQGPKGDKGDKGDRGAQGAVSAKTVIVNTQADLSSSIPAPVIASLPLSAGSYVITARANAVGRATTSTVASCTLQAGAASDSFTWFGNQSTSISASSQIVLSVSHTFAANGVAELRCSDTTSQPSAIGGVRITAVEVQTIG